MAVLNANDLPLQSDRDVVMARQLVRKLCQELGFNLVDQTKMVTAASELARNARTYGGGGTMRWEKLQDGSRVGLQLTFEDQGPGIPDVAQALTDGWTSGNGLGMGLSGAKRLVQDFHLQTAVGAGTKVVIARWH
jgi:serine/threonine-protein kinase RsbT